MSNMDPFDEFEFKPLTDGLGFHKKTVSLKDGLKNTGVINDELQTMPLGMLEDAPKTPGKRHTFEDVLSALEKSPLKRTHPSDLKISEPLPREPNGQRALEVEVPLPSAPPVQSPFPRPEAYKTPVVKRPAPATTVSEARAPSPQVGVRRGAADSPQRRLRPTAVSFASAFLDGIIIMALSLVFLVALLMVTKVDLSVVMKNLNRDLMTKISLGLLFVAVMQMYAVVARSFFGRTLGEWTFDLQMGEDAEHNSESYPLRVALRSLIVTATGLVVLPLISALLDRDLAGKLSGVQLYRQGQ